MMRVWTGLRLAVCAVVAVYMVAPLVIVVVISFSSAAFLTFPPPGFSFRWYYRIAENPVWLRTLWTSVQVTVPSALIATAAGTAAAIGLARAVVPGATVVAGLLLAPMVVPVIIVAAAIYSVFRPWGLTGTVTGLALAHALLSLPYVLASVLTALETVDRRLEGAAMTLGAAPWSVFRRVTLPLILPGVLSGLLFALVVSFDEVVVSIFISTTQVRPVTVQMWSDVRGDIDPTISAVATVLFLVSLTALAIEHGVRRRGERRVGGVAA
jgi:putative spermidine/putrescine transport system permease protein